VVLDQITESCTPWIRPVWPSLSLAQSIIPLLLNSL
jgi:hypothetical protein